MEPEQVRLTPDIDPGDDSRQSNPHILIIEPDDERRSTCTAVLQATGYQVTALADGAAALAEAARVPPDLIIMFVDPRPTSLELCHQFRSDADTRDTPVIVLTKRDDPFVREQVVRAGGSAILTVPLKATRLLHKVRRLLARSKPRTP